jgi:hypothetical protein
MRSFDQEGRLEEEALSEWQEELSEVPVGTFIGDLIIIYI